MADPKIVLTAQDQTKAAFDSVKQNLAGLKTSAAAVTGVLGTLGITAYAVKMADDIRGVLEQWDELGKSAQRAGFESAQSMAEVQFAAKLAGVEAGGFETAIGKLSAKMADAAGGNKEAAALFEAMGVKVKDATGSLRSNEAVLDDLAGKFASYKDGPEKTALALALFGKAGKELIPLLNGGSEALQKQREEFRVLRGEISDGAVKAAEQFNDNLTRLQAASDGLSRSLAASLVDSLTQVTDKMVEAAKKGGVLYAVLQGIFEAAKIGTGTDELGVAKSRVSNANTQLGDIDTKMFVQNAILERDPDNTAAQRALKNLRKQLQETQREALAATEAVNRLLNPTGDADGSYGAAETRRLGGGRKSAPIADKTGGAVEITAYDVLSKRVKERLAEQDQELTKGVALTEQEKFRAKIETDAAEAKKKLTATEREALQAQLDSSSAKDRDIRLRTVEIANNAVYAREWIRDNDEMAQAEARRNSERGRVAKQNADDAEALKDSNDALRLEAQLIGASEQESAVRNEQMRIELDLRKKLRDLERNPLLDQDARDKEGAALRANAEEAKRQVAFKANIDLTRQFGDDMRSDLRGALVSGFQDGKNPAAAFAAAFASTLRSRVSESLADGLLDMAGIGRKSTGSYLTALLPGGTGAFTAAFSQTELGSSGFGSGLAYGNADLGEFLHGGGIAGSEATFTRQVHPSVYRDALRYHAGGIAGDEVPAILQEGEGVFTKGQMRALGGTGRRVSITVAPVITIDSRSDRGAVAQDVNRALAQNNKALFEQLRKQGVLT